MPRKDYFYYLDGRTRLVIYFKTESGVVERFVVKLEYEDDGVWRELLRYDSFHGFVHKDVLSKSGEKKRVIRYLYLEPGTGLIAAIADCVENYSFYVERWLNG